MNTMRKFELTSKANLIADIHAFEHNLPEPKRCLEHDIDDELTPDEWQFIQKQYETVFAHVRNSMVKYHNFTRRIEKMS